MKKKYRLVLSLILVVFIITGCTNKYGIDTSKYNTDGLKVVKCNRDTTTDDGSKVKIDYKVYYDKKDYLKVFESTEIVTSNDNSVLDTYEKAYKNVYKAYKDIDYYENAVVRDNNSVTSKTYINYDKVDLNKIMEIEGTDDNVKVINGKIKIDDWIKFAKKYGTSCK